MIRLYTAVAEQVVEPGDAIVFDNTPNRLSRRSGQLCQGVYEVHFSANVTGTVPVELTVYVGGEPLPETTVISNVAGEQNVATMTAFRAFGGERVTVVNTGDEDVTVTNAKLFVAGR